MMIALKILESPCLLSITEIN